MSKQDSIYQKVTDQIVTALEAGTPPWIKPWKATAHGQPFPHNADTGRSYHGINVLLLQMVEMARGYQSSGWMTFKQAQKRGGYVRKGERGQSIVFWKPMRITDKDDVGNETGRTIPMIKEYHVFNVAQIEGLELPAEQPSLIEDEPPALMPQIEAVGAAIHYGGDRACYSPASDSIRCPVPEAFTTVDHFYSTILHEITHWTGHRTRCDRDLSGRFGNQAYAAEELIAEIGSAFLCASLGVPLESLQHPSYVANWLEVLRNDNRAIFTASRKAQEACDHVLARINDNQREAA